MNKKITSLISALFMGCALFAQNNLLLGNFEDGTVNDFGTNGGGNVKVANAINPKPDAVNATDKVLQVTYTPGYASWEGILDTAATTFTLKATPNGSSYRYLHFTLLSTLNGGTSIATTAINTANNTEEWCSKEYQNTKFGPSEADWSWEYIVMDLLENTASGTLTDGATYRNLSIQFDKWAWVTDGFVYYVDNIYLSNSPNPINFTAIETVKSENLGAYVSRAGEIATLHLNMAENGHGKIEVLNLQGQVMNKVFDGKISAGQSTFDFPVWNAGLHLLRITTDQDVKCLKF
jgi:hypothetical protein